MGLPSSSKVHFLGTDVYHKGFYSNKLQFDTSFYMQTRAFVNCKPGSPYSTPPSTMKKSIVVSLMLRIELAVLSQRRHTLMCHQLFRTFQMSKMKQRLRVLEQNFMLNKIFLEP